MKTEMENGKPQRESSNQVIAATFRLSPASQTATTQSRIAALSESYRDVPAFMIPEKEAAFAEAHLPEAIRLAEEALQAGDPAEVLASLKQIALRRGMALPEGLILDLDVEILASWPGDIFRKAFLGVWENFRYRRFPEVPDFKEHVADALEARKAQLTRLQLMERKIKALRRFGDPSRDGKRKNEDHAIGGHRDSGMQRLDAVVTKRAG